ncbi:tail fiber domain-containing protein [bacterium]|nr:tail fiber domain-containing protein [bacterium]
MKTKFTFIFALLAFQLSLSFGQTSAVPGTISYQGRVYNPDGTLLGAGTPVNRTVIFRIWDSPSATTQANLLYSESQTVTISEGEFSVLVGNGIANTTQTYSYSETSKHSSASPAVNLANVFNGATRYLSVTVANASTISVSDSEISPRQQIVSSAFAFRSKFAEVLGTSASGNSLQVLDNGNVGVGNASPPSALTVTGASSSTASPQLLLTATDTTERLRLGVNDTGNGTGFIQAWKEGSGSQNLTLNSDGGNVGIGNSAPTNQLSVTGAADFSGNVGIGVTSPLAKLHVNGNAQFRSGTASHGFIQMQPGNDTRAGGLSWYKPGGARLGYMGLNSTDVLLGLENSANFKVIGGEVGIGMDPTNPLSVSGNADFNGKVGIGTTTPELPLHAVVIGSNVAARFESGSKGSGNAAFADFAGGRAYVGYDGITTILGSPSGTLAKDLVLAPGNVGRYEIKSSDGTHTWNTGANAGATKMVLSSAGNLGIGNSAPNMKLAIADGASDPVRYGSVQITREASNHTAAHMAFVRAGSSVMGLGFQRNSNWFGFGTGTTGSFSPSNLRMDGSHVLIHSSQTMGRLNVGVKTSSYTSIGRLSTSGASGTNDGRPNSPISIWADGHVVGSLITVHSDERIKTAIKPSDSREDLGTLLGIEIADYKYIDTIANGNKPQKKVIAQQVENVFPQAVNRSTGSIPDIFKGAEIADGWVLLATDLKVGERVRLITENEESIEEVIEVRGDAFRTAFKPGGEQVFVHGREVEDYRTVDYDAIAMLNVSATQQIKKELDAVKIENAKLKNQLAALMAEVAKADKAREARLLAIEQRLLGATKTTVSIASQNKAAAQ